MAKLSITKLLQLGVDDHITSADWQVARDEAFTDLVLDIKEDTYNIKSLHIELRDPDTGMLVDGYDGLYARVRLHVNGFISPWFVLPGCYEDGNKNNDGLDDYVPEKQIFTLPHNLPHKFQ